MRKCTGLLNENDSKEDSLTSSISRVLEPQQGMTRPTPWVQTRFAIKTPTRTGSTTIHAVSIQPLHTTCEDLGTAPNMSCAMRTKLP